MAGRCRLIIGFLLYLGFRFSRGCKLYFSYHEFVFILVALSYGLVVGWTSSYSRFETQYGEPNACGLYEGQYAMYCTQTHRLNAKRQSSVNFELHPPLMVLAQDREKFP